MTIIYNISLVSIIKIFRCFLALNFFIGSTKLHKLDFKMIYYIKTLVIIFLSFYCTIFSHPFHATISSFECKKNNKSIEVTIKFFTNDLEKALRNDRYHDLIIDSQKSMYNIDSLIFVYINKNLSLSIDKKEKQLSWVGKEIENDITWCYLEVINIDNISSIKMENKLLLSVFDDQLNICHFYCGDKPETIMLHKEKYIGEIKY